jgi:hypothetical protein
MKTNSEIKNCMCARAIIKGQIVLRRMNFCVIGEVRTKDNYLKKSKMLESGQS